MIQANWLAFALALVIGLLVAWWLFGRASSQPARRERRPDVLDEGAAPAQRTPTRQPANGGTRRGLGQPGTGRARGGTWWGWLHDRRATRRAGSAVAVICDSPSSPRPGTRPDMTSIPPSVMGARIATAATRMNSPPIHPTCARHR